MKKILYSILLLSVFQTAPAQDRIGSLLQQIEQNSTTLKTLLEQKEARMYGNRTGLTPSNPEVEFTHLWGNEHTGGNSKEVGVTQALDFPTVYSSRTRIARLQNHGEEQTYAMERLNLLLAAKTICLEMTYYNAMALVYERQVGNARQIARTYERLKEHGDGNLIEYNKAALNLANIDNLCKQNRIERERLHAELVRMNGGKEIDFEETEFEEVLVPEDFETWYQNVETAFPSMKLLKNRIEVAREEIKLSRAENFPKIQLGYRGEMAGGEQFHGLSIGISIPLWENRNRTSQAKAASVAAQYEMTDAGVFFYNQLKYLFDKANSLKENVSRYEVVIRNCNNDELLFKAYDSGEMSLLDYLLEMQYYFDTWTQYLSAKRDLSVCIAQMNAIYL